MEFPIRCFTCGCVIADKYDDYLKRTQNGENKINVLEDLGVTRFCCKRMFLGSTNMMEKVNKYRRP